MSDGRTHFAASATASLVYSVAAVYIVPHSPELALGIEVGAFLGIFVHPDLDHHVKTWEYHFFAKRSRKFADFWEWFWTPYSNRYRHRGTSHKPIVGTWTRYKFFLQRSFFLPLILWCLVWAPYYIPMIVVTLTIFCMMCLQDILHLAFDGFRYRPGKD